METALGLLGLLAWIVCTIGLAAAITWSVIKVIPAERKPKGPKQSPPEPSEQSS